MTLKSVALGRRTALDAPFAVFTSDGSSSFASSRKSRFMTFTMRVMLVQTWLTSFDRKLVICAPSSL